MELFSTYFDMSGIGGHIGVAEELPLWSGQGQLVPQSEHVGVVVEPVVANPSAAVAVAGAARGITTFRYTKAATQPKRKAIANL
jgi:hypothetical protein